MVALESLYSCKNVVTLDLLGSDLGECFEKVIDIDIRIFTIRSESNDEQLSKRGRCLIVT